jgi:hypothetical protein
MELSPNDVLNDVIHINIGGQTVMAIQRKILTSVEGSLLASIFSGRWDESIPKDKGGNFLIDFPFDLLLPMIDYLRMKTIETSHDIILSPSVDDFGGRSKKFNEFILLMEYYGMTHGIFPTEIKQFVGPCTQTPIQSWHPHSFHICTSKMSSFALVGHRHSRKVKAFDVTLGKVETVRIGWARGYGRSIQTQFQETSPFGNGGHGICLEVLPIVSCRLLAFPVCNKDRQSIPDSTVENGAVIRCQLARDKLLFVWLVSENEITLSRSCYFPSYGGGGCIHDQWDCWKSDLIPVVAGIGEWWVSNIEFDK